MDYFNTFFFAIYPYIAMSIFVFGSLIRFDYNQYSWKSDSSQVLQSRGLRVGNILFHVGILGIFFGHLVGLLTPVIVWDTLGISHTAKQIFAMAAGGVMGSITFVGLLMLIVRRFGSKRISINSTWRDKILLLWLFITLCLGLSTIFVSAGHLDGKEMVKLMSWAQHIVTFRPGAVEMIRDVSLIFKLHMIMGMSLFVIFPFTRLVHIWSGFASIFYLIRPPQVVRTNKLHKTNPKAKKNFSAIN